MGHLNFKYGIGGGGIGQGGIIFGGGDAGGGGNDPEKK